MAAKQEILKAIRGRLPEAASVPDSNDAEWIRFDDADARFASVLADVGGRCVTVDSLDELQRDLESHEAWVESARVVSAVDGFENRNVDPQTLTAPQDLADVEFAVVPGDFCVAENGAVWVNDRHLKFRALVFVVAHLAVVVPADQMVQNMHEAYRRLSFGGRLFGTFLSGPSKTADIEQSLVIGAQGPCSMTVYRLTPVSS